MTLTRRGILGRLGLVAGLLLPRVATAQPAPAGHLDALADLGAARRIGHAYLTVCPEDGDHRELSAWLDRTLGRPADVPAARTALQRAVQEDMRAGRSVVVDGWILSLTEARLCALALLG